MKKSFMCSLICRGGIVGGDLYLDENSVTYKTNKLTVDKAYKNLILPLDKIAQLTWKWIVFTVATLHMKGGEKYSFIIFNKWRFNKWFQEYRFQLENQK